MGVYPHCIPILSVQVYIRLYDLNLFVSGKDSSSLKICNYGQKLYGQLRKTALSLTPQAMHSQFKIPSAGSVREVYYIYRKT